MTKQTIEQVRALPENKRVIVTVTRDSGLEESIGFRRPKRLEVERVVSNEDKLGALPAINILLKECCITHTPQELDEITDESDISAVGVELMNLRNVGVVIEKKA